MKNRSEIPQIQRLFDALLPLSDAGRKEYLALHPDLPSQVVEQTLPMLQADNGDLTLPSLDTFLSMGEPLFPNELHSDNIQKNTDDDPLS